MLQAMTYSAGCIVNVLELCGHSLLPNVFPDITAKQVHLMLKCNLQG